jgi:hypothetical protein
MDLLAEELTADAPATDPPDDEPRVSSHPVCSSWPTTSPR